MICGLHKNLQVEKQMKSKVTKFKALALNYFPGARTLRDIRNNYRNYMSFQQQVERIERKCAQFDRFFKNIGISNLTFFNEVLSEKFDYSASFLNASKAQLNQDLFVLLNLNLKKNGYFVEFGATDGFNLSNTYLLEKHFGWSGILAEPGRSWHNALIANRDCSIEKRCVYKSTGDKIIFLDASRHELSTIIEFANNDYHSALRKQSDTYEVETISLSDMLAKYDAPKVIDYLSIDTEGSELEILSAFDFNEYDIRVITVEHNYTANREKIYDLLISAGFKRVYEDYSQFDDWYVRNSIEQE